MKRIISPVNAVLLVWPLVMWFFLWAMFNGIDPYTAKFIFTHPIEFIGVLFILNAFGSHFYKLASEKKSL